MFFGIDYARNYVADVLNKGNGFIWLFGENLAETAQNNSFYFWKHVVNTKRDNIK